jgi:hypothetical protein
MSLDKEFCRRLGNLEHLPKLQNEEKAMSNTTGDNVKDDIVKDLLWANFKGLAPPQDWTHRAVSEIQRLQAQIAELQSAKASAVSVPVEVYNFFAKQMKNDLTRNYGILGLESKTMARLFLSACDPINKPESGV